MSAIREMTVEADDILRQLDRILADRRFAGAGRTAQFLRYVVEKTVTGAAGEIKETVIAADLYRRSTDYDPSINSVVRVEATRVRNKLTAYYQDAGRRDPIAISIPKGTYVPQFTRRMPELAALETSIVASAGELPVVSGSPTLLRPRGMRHAIPWVALACLCFMTPYLWTHAAAWSWSARASDHESTQSGIPPEAFAAWEEGNALLEQDPHMGSSEHGAPQILLRAIERYEFAVAQAPSFARGWASLAEAYEYAYPYIGRDPAKDAQRAEFAARRAVASNDKLAIAHAHLAMVLFYLRWDFAGAEAEYRRALQLDRRLPYAVAEYADLLRETGRFSQAELEVTKARAVLPALPVLASKQAEIELDRNRVEAAIVTAGSAVRLKRDYGRAYVVLGMAYEKKDLLVDALEQYRAALRMDAEDRRALPAYGYLLARMGRRDEARTVLRQLISMNDQLRNCAFQVAVVYTGLGEHDRALDWLEHAYNTRQMHVPFMGVEARLKPLRSSARFRAILSRIGIRPV